MNIHDLYRTVGKRLHQRQLQAAAYGISADPVITIEAEELSSLKRSINRAVTIHSEGGYIKQIEDAVIAKSRALGIYIDTLEYE